jgi:hypothetical protein
LGLFIETHRECVLGGEEREKKLEFNWIKLVNSSKCNTIKSKIAFVYRFYIGLFLVFFVAYHPVMH